MIPNHVIVESVCHLINEQNKTFVAHIVFFLYSSSFLHSLRSFRVLSALILYYAFVTASIQSMLEIKMNMEEKIKLSAKFIGDSIICAVYLTTCCELSMCVCLCKRMNSVFVAR